MSAPQSLITSEQIDAIVFKALHSLNDELTDENKVEVNTQTPLFGKDAKIESLSLVSLIVDVEGELNSEFNLDISLTDDRAMTRAISPFTNVQSLKDYILELAAEKAQ